MEIKVKKLSEGAIIPKKSSTGAIAYDVYAPKDCTIHRGRQILKLDIAMAIPYGYEAKIEPRSGFSIKGMPDRYGIFHDCDVLQGKIDSDYRGCIGVIINNRDCPFQIAKGMRIAQLTIYSAEDADWDIVDRLDATERGNGGFGHTGAY